MERFMTVTEMSEILGISKTRLYDLIRDGILPEPMRNPSNNRPVFNAELTEACRQVIKTRVGINGQPYTPNRRRKTGSGSTGQPSRRDLLIASLSGLGLNATPRQVDDVLKTLPDAGRRLEEGDLVKQVFLRLRQKP